ncbi:MAG: DUF4339 domain-containing protein [Acidobacteriota bacterium]
MAQELWYYLKNDQQFGPVSEAELQALIEVGEISRENLAWRQGDQEWKETGSFERLASSFKTPPPPPPIVATPPPAPTSAPVAHPTQSTAVYPTPRVNGITQAGGGSLGQGIAQSAVVDSTRFQSGQTSQAQRGSAPRPSDLYGNMPTFGSETPTGGLKKKWTESSGIEVPQEVIIQADSSGFGQPMVPQATYSPALQNDDVESEEIALEESPQRELPPYVPPPHVLPPQHQSLHHQPPQPAPQQQLSPAPRPRVVRAKKPLSERLYSLVMFLISVKKLLGIGVAGAAAIAATAVVVTREPVHTTQSELYGTVVPAGYRGPVGQIKIDAYPWGTLSLLSRGGRSLEVPGDLETPLVLLVEPGTYRVEIGAAWCNLEVGEGTSRTCSKVLRSVDVETYYQEVGW